MKIIVTGSKGFIGNHLVSYLETFGHEVYGWSKDGLALQSKVVLKGDLLQEGDVRFVINRIEPDCIFHCAGSADVKFSIQNPYEDLIDNYITTHNLVFALKNENLNNCIFVLLSSAAVYGNPNTIPMNEAELINPLSPYALHKRAAEEVCLYMKYNFDMRIKILRIFSVYGPGLKKQLFWDMYNKIKKTNELNLMGTGEESRDFIFINDLIEAMVLIANSEIDDSIFNVGNGVEITIKKAAAEFAEIMGLSNDSIHFSGQKRQGDPINWCADISKLKSLGYEQNYSFKNGIKMYIDWIKRNNF